MSPEHTEHISCLMQAINGDIKPDRTLGISPVDYNRSALEMLNKVKIPLGLTNIVMEVVSKFKDSQQNEYVQKVCEEILTNRSEHIGFISCFTEAMNGGIKPDRTLGISPVDYNRSALDMLNKIIIPLGLINIVKNTVREFLKSQKNEHVKKVCREILGREIESPVAV